MRYDFGVSTYRKSSHTVYLLHYHFVFATKYRKPVLRGDVALRVRELIREICRSNDIEIVRGHVSGEHVHLLLSVPPSLAPSRVMQAIKGKTSHHLLADFRAPNEPACSADSVFRRVQSPIKALAFRRGWFTLYKHSAGSSQPGFPFGPSWHA